MRRVLAAIAAAVVSFLCIGQAHAAPAMWVARDADSEIFLFGTVHMLQPGVDWRTPAFDAAYARAEQVWFEVAMDSDPAAVRALMSELGADPSRGLTRKLSPAARRGLGPLLKKENISLEAVEAMRPWAAALLLSVQPMKSRGYKVDRGADAVITRASHKAAKTVRTFETFEDQLRLFAQLPEAVEVQYLEDIIREQVEPPADRWTLQGAWLDGDVDLLEERMVRQMRSARPLLYEVLLKRRNQSWAATLEAEMAEPGVQLVNVGALHMIGPHGLPALLQARGFSVERVQ